MYKVPIEIYKEIERRFKCVKPWSEAYCELYSLQNFLYMLDDWWLKETGWIIETKPEEKPTECEHESCWYSICYPHKHRCKKCWELYAEQEDQQDHEKAMEIPEVEFDMTTDTYTQCKILTNSLNAVIRYLKSNNL